MRFTSLASGSEGNALLLEACAASQQTFRVLVDCGLSPTELGERLAGRGLELSSIDLVVVTHEHGDHSAGAARVARLAQCPLLCTHGTRLAMGEAFEEVQDLIPVRAGSSLELLGIEIELITVPHDAREPIAVRFSNGQRSLAVVTDLGHVSAHLIEALQGLDGLFLEFNHDPEMLRLGPYTPRLKARIGGDYGHLSNAQAVALLGKLMSSRLQHVVAAHLSQVNNSEERVYASVSELNWGKTQFQIASQREGAPWVTLE